MNDDDFPIALTDAQIDLLSEKIVDVLLTRFMGLIARIERALDEKVEKSNGC